MIRRRPGGRPRVPTIHLQGEPGGNINPASFGPTQYIWGTHAAVFNDAENLKSIFWKSARAVVATVLGAVLITAPQVYADIQPGVFKSVGGTNNTRVIQSFSSAPLQIDLTQQATFSKPLSGNTPTVIPIVLGQPQTNPSQLDAEVWKSATAVITTPNPIASFLKGSPQTDPSQLAASIFPLVQTQPVSVPFAPTEYTHGTHAVALYTAEGLKSTAWKSALTPPAVNPNLLGKFVQIFPEQKDYSLKASFAQPLIGIVTTPQQIVPFVYGRAEDVATITAYVAESLTTQIASIVEFIGNTPVELPPLAAKVWSPINAVAITPNPIAKFYSTVPQIEDRPTTKVFASVVSGQTPPVIKSIWAAPEQIDLNLQAKLSALIPAPPVQSYGLPIIVAAPQQIDLTQQAILVRPITVPPITGIILKSFVAGPQLIDLTLKAQFFEPPIIGTVHRHGSGRAHKEERRGIDWSLPFSFQGAVKEVVVKPTPVEVKVKKLPKQDDLDYYSDLVVALEKKIEYYNQQLKHLKDNEPMRQLKRSEKIKEALAVLNRAKKTFEVIPQEDDDDEDDLQTIMLLFGMED